VTTATSSRAEVAREPAFYRRRKKRSPELLGQILLRQGALAPQLLRKALRIQEERGGQLGRILLAAGACTEETLAQALLEQLRHKTARGHVSTSVAARNNPALAGLRVVASPVLTTCVLLLTDTAALLGAALAGHGVELARNGTLSPVTLPLLGLAVATSLAAFTVLGLYRAMAPSPPDELRNATAATTLALSCVGAVTLLHGGRHAWSLPLCTVTWAAALLLVPLARALVRSQCARRSWWGHPVVVLGAGKTGRLVVRTLRANPRCGLKPVVLLDDDRTKQGTLRADVRDDAVELHSVNHGSAELATPSLRAMSAALLEDDERSSVRARPAATSPKAVLRARGMFAEVEGIPVVGGLALAPVLAERLGVPYAIVAMPGLSSEKLAGLVERVGGFFSHLLVIPDLFGLASLGVPARDVDGILGLEVRQQLLLPGPRLAKRIMDVALTLVGGALILPLLLLLGAVIRLDSRGPVLYAQDRLGRDGRRFRALKFRTMHGDGEARLRAVLEADPGLRAEYEEFHKLSDDPRVTRVGRVLRKYSLDELPQLWNVLTGDMSLVGPRPYLEREIPHMDRREAIILRALPGMTGLWQVGDRNATRFEARVATDVQYVRNWSPWLDAWVLARTLGVVVRGTGS
jgi:lipopolysaccharide/colanic/teichoic acid biosynthesis glycosyltransferase